MHKLKNPIKKRKKTKEKKVQSCAKKVQKIGLYSVKWPLQK